VLTAYLDEAGTHAGCPVVTVAGYYGNVEQWQAFRELWKPHSCGFHAKDGDRKYPDIFDAIAKSEINGVFLALGKDRYRAHSTEITLSRFGNEYAMCAFQCVLSICKEVGAPTAFVLEQGQPNLNYVLKTLLYMLESGETCISSVTPARKADFIELHPADFVAHLASSGDRQWLDKLAAIHRLKRGDIPSDTLDNVGKELDILIAKAKRERARAKRER
jgi:hypothetical protein